MTPWSGWPEDLEKKLQDFSKSSPNSLQVKKGQNIYNKAQFESPNIYIKPLLKLLKYLQQITFWKCFLGKNEINLLKQKVAKNVANSLGYFIFFFQKIIMSLQKLPNWQKLPNLVTLALINFFCDWSPIHQNFDQQKKIIFQKFCENFNCSGFLCWRSLSRIGLYKRTHNWALSNGIRIFCVSNKSNGT
jgi:hypothetical protein